MFTGIIQDIGTILSVDKTGDWTLAVAVSNLRVDKMAIGASIACNGICLTMIEKEKVSFKAQVSAETISRTTVSHWQPHMFVNLEPALRMGDDLGGHLVSGHIDGVARITAKQKDGDSLRLSFQVPHEFTKFIASKGSIALNGVSLTVNEVEKDRFGVNIIPHTLNQTTFGDLEVDGEVNFEVDLMARYAERLLSQGTK